MKLHELDAQRQTEQVAKTLKTRLGDRVEFGKLSESQARGMLSKVRGLLKEYKTSVSRHYSERNPDYLRLMMMEQALSSHLSEMNTEVMAVDMNDPKTQSVMKKAQSGQTLTPDEQKTVTAIASMKKEAKKFKKMVSESELQQAQVVLAAQDMIDRVQGMMEDVSEMQFKDLPALTDSIKNDMGVEQAQQFQADSAAALTQLLAAIQAAKTQLEAAQGVLTGQAPVVPGQTEPGTEPAVDAELDLDVDANLPPVGDEEEEELTATSLGRERR